MSEFQPGWQSITNNSLKKVNSHENDCFNIVRSMILAHGIDVVRPCLKTLQKTLDRHDYEGVR